MAETESFKFPSRWWLSSGAVRRLTPEERDFGVTLMCFMAEGNPPGTLTDQNGKPLSRRQVLDMTSMPEERALKMLNNLVSAGVIVRESGTRLLFNPQMRRDAELSETRRQAGRKGGIVTSVRKLAVDGEDLPLAKTKQKSLSVHIPEDWKPSDEEMGRLITLADVVWPRLTYEERVGKIKSTLKEFIVYWTELKVIDTETGSHKGKKGNWYMTFRKRLQNVSFNERRTATYARMRTDSSVKVGTSQNGASPPPNVCPMCEAAKNDNSLPPCQFHGRR
jgi:hypothetical protein